MGGIPGLHDKKVTDMDGSSSPGQPAPAAAVTLDAKPKMTPQRRRLLMMIVPPVVVAIGVAIYLFMSAGYVSTDNATIGSARAPISSSVRGRVVEVLVH